METCYARVIDVARSHQLCYHRSKFYWAALKSVKKKQGVDKEPDN